MNKKQEQNHILKKIRSYCVMSNTGIALLSDTSPSLVSFVWAGVNNNTKVLEAIRENLTAGWEKELSPAELNKFINNFN